MSTFIINRNKKDNTYGVWEFNSKNKQAFTPVALNKNATFNSAKSLVNLGGYMLEWGPQDTKEKAFPYRLFVYDPTSDNPLAGETVQQGMWPVSKFWGYRKYYSNNSSEGQDLPLIPMGNFMLFFVGGEGRGTYELFNFDPNLNHRGSSDPLPSNFTSQGAFPSIQAGHELISIGNYVIDRMPDRSRYRIWSFDPQNPNPLSIPPVQSGKWEDIDSSHQLVPVGNKILDWVPGKSTCRLWDFDPAAKNPLSKLLYEGSLPEGMANSSSLLCVQPRKTVKSEAKQKPGSMGYMRSKIKHVVYYMVESRSFDNVCGWLYENDENKIHFVGSDKPFDGASTKNFNLDDDKKVFQNKFKDGKLSDDIVLQDQSQDPFHNNADGLSQMFYDPEKGYPKGAEPDMGGFVKNNANQEVMSTFTPNQLPVLNGLAKEYGISDEWFSSVPGGTEINRAFSVTGSAYNELNPVEGGNQYEYWPKYPHRPSIWKVLWNNGIKDWKIYNVIDWKNYPYTNHLFLEGQVPSLDASPNIESLETFKLQAKHGKLALFSFLEPIWIAPNGTTSYHPGAGASLVPAEIALKEIYEAIKTGPNWEDTLLVITFSKNGGIYDHVSPPYTDRPWPNDKQEDFKYDLMGPRVPAIMVSPWIKKHTVFRSGKKTPFDSTSFAATLLKWFGIQKSKWGLGDRIANAPTFEAIFKEQKARQDNPKIDIPYDQQFPKS